MPDKNSSTQTPAKSLESEFRFSSVSGPRLGSDLNEFQSLLILDAVAGTMTLEKHRSESDAEEAPIGRFEAPLDTKTFNQLIELVDSLGLFNLPPSTGGGPGATVFTFEYHHDTSRSIHSIGSFDHEQVAQVESVLDLLYQIQSKLETGAQTAIVVSIKRLGSFNDGHFELTIRNIGNAPLYFADPRWLDVDLDNWAGARVAILPEEIPGVTSSPLEWTEVYIARPQTQKPDSVDVLLHPQSEMTYATVNWTPKRAGNRYIIQGIYMSYQGPKEIHGVYRIRGAAFSKAIEKSY
ncbi:MAG: hypothetical protein WBP29_01950 [Candidatus Zixiibacteriota bacterium]